MQDSTSVRSLKESVHRDREWNGGGQRLEVEGRGCREMGNWYLMGQSFSWGR